MKSTTYVSHFTFPVSQLTFAVLLLSIGSLGLALTWFSGWNLVIWEVSGALWHVGLLVYSLFDSARRLGWRRTGAFFALVASVSLVAEVLGSQYGLIFGAYQYNTALGGLMIGGQVPVLVLFEWWVVLYMVTSMTDAILGRRLDQARAYRMRSRRSSLSMPVRLLLPAIGLDALAAANLDLSIDPVSVHFYQLWRWTDPGATSFQGIPVSNYAGWLLVVGLIALVFRTRLQGLPSFAVKAEGADSSWPSPPTPRRGGSELDLSPSPVASARTGEGIGGEGLSENWLRLVPAGLYLIFQLKMAATALAIGQAEVTFVSTLATLPFVLVAAATGWNVDSRT